MTVHKGNIEKYLNMTESLAKKYLPQNYSSETCGFCGTQLKRKVLRKTPLAKRD